MNMRIDHSKDVSLIWDGCLVAREGFDSSSYASLPHGGRQSQDGAEKLKSRNPSKRIDIRTMPQVT